MRLPIQERLQQKKPLLLDGATGTELSRRGIDLNTPSWTAQAILDAPQILAQVHRDYVDAGAELITANTFRTHARNLKAIGQSAIAGALTRRAVEIARSVAGPSVYVAGSVAPLEDCYSPHLTPDDDALLAEHTQMAEHLAASNVDLILIETQLTIREARIAAQAARSMEIPFAVSFVCQRNGNLLSDELLTDAFNAIAPLGPVAFLVNCIPVEEVLAALQPLMTPNCPIPLGAYANTGRLLANGSWETTSGQKSAVYAEHAREWISSGLQLIGGCCGTTPEHISAVWKII